MIIEMTPSYYVFFQLTPDSGWHRYPCKLDQEGKDNFVQKMTEKDIPTRVEEVKNEMLMFMEK